MVKVSLRLIVLGAIAIGLILATSLGVAAANPWVGKTAPDFSLQTLEGKTVTLNELKGKPVLLNFWACRCPHCQAEMSYFQEVYTELKDKELEIIGVNIKESAQEVSAYMDQNGYSLPVCLDTDGAVADSYGVRLLPSTYFIDKDGVIQEVVIAPFESKDDIINKLSKIIDLNS